MSTASRSLKWATIGSCQVCGADVIAPRDRSCSRRCTITAADRRRRGLPVDDTSYYACLDQRRHERMQGPAYRLVGLVSACEEKGCSRRATYVLMRDRRCCGPKLCTRHGRERLHALSGAVKSQAQEGP